MTDALRRRIPVIVAVAYAAIFLSLLTLAMVTTDEFGFRFIPVLWATYPLSRLLYRDSDILFSAIVGGVVNTILLFALLKGIAFLRASSATK